MTDMTVRVDRMPGPGETLEGTSFQLGNGGKGANQAVMAAMLGAKVEVVACVGDDEFGAAAIRNFAEWGIHTACVREVGGASTGVAPILVDRTGENRIVIVPGANSRMVVEDVDSAFATMEAPDAVLCQLEVPLDCVERALLHGREAGAVTVLNPAPFAPVSRETLELADWIVPNEIEFESLRAGVVGGQSGRLTDDVGAFGALLGTGVAVTCGEHGAIVYTAEPNGETQAVPARAASATDTTGAGDAFAGSFAYAIARGVEPLLAAEFACACASSSVERAGTQSSYPREPELTVLKSMIERETLGASG